MIKFKSVFTSNKYIYYFLISLLFLSNTLYCGDSLGVFIEEIPRLNTLEVKATNTTVDNVHASLENFTIEFNKSMDTTVTPILKIYFQVLVGGQIQKLELSPTYTHTWSNTSVLNDTLTFNLQKKYYFNGNIIYWGIVSDSVKSMEKDHLKKEPQWEFSMSAQYIPITKTAQYQCFNTSNYEEMCDTSNTLHEQQNGHNQSIGYVDLTGLGIDQTQIRQLKLPQAGIVDTVNSENNREFYIDDLTTGLVWKSCSEGQLERVNSVSPDVAFLDSCDGGNNQRGNVISRSPKDVSWVEAIELCANLNSMNNNNGFAGFTNWRLPSVSELLSIVDYGYQYQDSLISSQTRLLRTSNRSLFPNTSSNNTYWSSSFVQLNGLDLISTVNYSSGEINNLFSPVDLSQPKPVRCVANKDISKLINPKYEVSSSSSNIIEDEPNKLMWQRNLPSSPTESGVQRSVSCNLNDTEFGCEWNEALTYCRELTLGSHSDWRVPNIKELNSLITSQKNKLELPSLFNGSTSFWSSTTQIVHKENPSDDPQHTSAYIINKQSSLPYNVGTQVKTSLTNTYVSVKCVRDIP